MLQLNPKDVLQDSSCLQTTLSRWRRCLGLGRLRKPLRLLCTQGFLGTAFLMEGMLFAFHLKGSSLDMSLHVLLVLLVFAAALACYAEIG